jgi:PAS domain S-box-containing protein
MKDHYLKQELYSLIQTDQTIFEFLQEASLDGLWYWDLDHPEDEWMNPNFWITLGYDPEEMPHKSTAWQDIIFPEDLEKATQNFNAHLLDPEHPYDQEVRYRHKDGSTVWVRCRGLIVRDEKNQPTRMLGAHTDITRLKEIETQLATENRQLNTVLDSSGLYVLITDVNGKFNFFNRKFNEDFGWLPQVVIGKDSLPSVHPNDQKACTAAVEQCFETPGQAVQVDLRKPRKKGGWQTNRWNFSAQFNSEGTPEGILCIGYDISNKIELQSEYQMLVDNIGNVLLTTDLEGAILYTSKSWSSNFHLDQESTIGIHIAEYFFEPDRSALLNFIAELAAGSLTSKTLEHRLLAGDGTPSWVETKCNLDTDGNRLIFLIRDISERKEADQKFKKTTDLLEETQQIAHVGGWRLDLDSGQTTWTNEVYRIHEVPLDFDHDRESAIQFYPPDDRQKLLDALDIAMKKRESFDQTFQFYTAKGNHRWVRVTGAPIIQEGKVTEIQGLFQDITDQKNALIELTQNQEQLASLTANVPGAVMQYKQNPDQSNEILYLSDGAMDIWAIEPKEALLDSRVVWNAMLPEYIDGMQHAIADSARNMTPFSYDWQVKHKDGSVKWLSGKGTPKQLPDGSMLWNTLVTDITSLKKAQQKLKSQTVMQERLMHIASEYINFPIEEMDDRIQSSLEEIGRFMNADRAYLIQYDFTHKTASNTHEWCGPNIEAVKDTLQRVPMEEYHFFIKHHIAGKHFLLPAVADLEDGPMKADLLRQGIKSLITVPMINKDKCFGCVGFNSINQVHEYTDSDLKLLNVFSEVLVNAITRAATDQELRYSQEKQSKLTASVPGAIYQMEMDPQGNTSFPFISEGITDLHEQLTPAGLLENPQLGFSVIHPDDLPQIMEKIEVSRTELTSFFADYRIVWPNGQIKWNRSISRPERREDGTVVWYGIFQDITEQRKLEQIKKFAEELEVKNKELEQFTYVASHDLQEPLRTIKSYSGLLSHRFSDDLNEDGQQFLKFIGDASLRMSNLIRGLLDYSQIGRDKKISEVDCNKLIDEVLQDLGSSIELQNAQIEVAKLPTLKGYELELRQLFQNLIGNAIKFHRPGQIPIVEVGGIKHTTHWQFFVRDNGIGVAPLYQEKIFTIFQRLNQSKEFDGTGIGLAHCKKIVEMHHGKIWLESKEGEGSTFFFTLKKGEYESKIG